MHPEICTDQNLLYCIFFILSQKLIYVCVHPCLYGFRLHLVVHFHHWKSNFTDIKVLVSKRFAAGLNNYITFADECRNVTDSLCFTNSNVKHYKVDR